ncbi:hypothetical protein K1T71_007871 [Dendrolimus kikuchii]|uniref:Uncharacterized protein n=1 Tax=Dendrolimus kikuchii TaxID=765133 RepID=A0ACC1CZY0_9NEOP|nr:hypothetical protein K1T71_007871 [Dendrolimus kikuchii]
MAGVKSLAVRGIRSFGPDDSDEQRISFERPLTLILGQNGCGKTTIIECLRYAITGQMPPGSRNECFVHDAKVNRSTEVLGQVKLKIINAKDKLLEVTRSMKVTAMQKKTRFQTLESFLSVIDENGTTKDVSSRCADLDFVMNEELGVSRAILNSVIFCHQEDASWPLDEGKKVKERFDEIFDADKYSDCFDRLRKMRKDYANNLKLLEQEVGFLTDKKKDLDKKKLEVVDTESKISEFELKVAELVQEVKPITEKLQAIRTLEHNLLSYETKREKIKVRLEHCRAQEEKLKKEIKTIFEGTKEELEENIKNYEATTKAKQKELEESYKKNTSFNKEEEKIANEKTSNERKFSNFTLLESQNQEKMDKRNKMIVETANLAGIEELAEPESNDGAEKALEIVSDKVKSLKKELADLKAQIDTEEKKLQAAINESLVALYIITMYFYREYKVVENEMNIEESQQEINDDEKALERHEQEREEISAKITKLQKQTAKLKERDMIQESLKETEKKFAVYQIKHKGALTELLGNMPEKDFAISVNKFECNVRSEVETMKKDLKKKQTEITTLEAERKHVREMLNERRAELTKAEDQMYKVCGTQSYDATLSKLNSTVEKLQDEQNVLQSSMFIIAKYKTQLKDNSCCPLCNRGFDNDTEVTDLISQLTTQVMNVPAKLEKVTEELQRTSAKKDELLSMKAVNEKITSLKEKDIPQLEKRMTDVDTKLASLNESVEEVSMALIEPEQKMTTAKQIHGEMLLLDRYTHEMKSISKKLEAIQEQCGDLDTSMSLDEATSKQSDLSQKITTLRTRIKTTQKKLNMHNKKLQSMTDKKNKIKEEVLNIQKKVQELVNLQTKKEQLLSDAEKLQVELKELEENITPLEDVRKEKENEKNEAVKKNREIIDTKNNYITSVVSSYDKVKAIDTEIKQHFEKNIPREMEKIKEANEKLMEKQKQIMDDRQVLTKRIDTLKDEIAKQAINKRDLCDNLDLRKAQTEIENCEKEDAELNEKLSGINRDSLSEKESLIGQQDKLIREKENLNGRLKELNLSLKHSRVELKKMQNKDIEKKFKEKFYELHVTKAIDKDIRDYAVTLEKCLMEFHREKMEHINLIIKELWRKIYQGNDIDYIEIKTEGSMTTDSERRKYDYRVVQCKNGVEIDMRGRCSAGQKVLACLIIRLALAETFSSRFGVLALDEPTTNLDEDNVRSLCSALGEIVQERMTQRNFMFIIITHDKEFIESLGNIDKVTHYYEVSRNEDGKSRIKRIRFT